jgi:hypothetical protein
MAAPLARLAVNVLGEGGAEGLGAPGGDEPEVRALPPRIDRGQVPIRALGLVNAPD